MNFYHVVIGKPLKIKMFEFERMFFSDRALLKAEFIMFNNVTQKSQVAM